MAKAVLLYADDEVYEIELFDRVDLCHAWCGPETFSGTITAIYPKKREVRVRYEDHTDWVKKTAEPKIKVMVVPIAAVTLVRRDE
jgi:hypothetical protein